MADDFQTNPWNTDKNTVPGNTPFPNSPNLPQQPEIPSAPMMPNGYGAPTGDTQPQNPAVQPAETPPSPHTPPAYGAPPPASPYPTYPQPTYTQPNYIYNYYQQQQPGYVPPYYPNPIAPNQKGDGLAVASLVLGILSVVTCCAWGLSIVCGIIGLILGIVAKIKGSSGMSVAGIVLNCCGIALGIFCLIGIASTGSFSVIYEESLAMCRFL